MPLVTTVPLIKAGEISQTYRQVFTNLTAKGFPIGNSKSYFQHTSAIQCPKFFTELQQQ